MRINVSIFEAIIEEITNGSNLNQALKSRKIPVFEFFKIMSENAKLQELYNQAQEFRAEFHAESVVEIADTDENPARARNRIDARKWFASKIKPQKYGERLELQISKTVDIRAAIDQGRARVLAGSAEMLRSPRDPKIEAKNQAIEIKAESLDRLRGQEPVDVEEPPSNDEPSIFD